MYPTDNDITPVQQTPPDKLQILYNALHDKYSLGTYGDFKYKMQFPEKRSAFYGAVSKAYNLGAYDEFNNKIEGAYHYDPAPVPFNNVNVYNTLIGVQMLDFPKNMPQDFKDHYTNSAVTEANYIMQEKDPEKIKNFFDVNIMPLNDKLGRMEEKGDYGDNYKELKSAVQNLQVAERYKLGDALATGSPVQDGNNYLKYTDPVGYDLNIGNVNKLNARSTGEKIKDATSVGTPLQINITPDWKYKAEQEGLNINMQKQASVIKDLQPQVQQMEEAIKNTTDPQKRNALIQQYENNNAVYELNDAIKQYDDYTKQLKNLPEKYPSVKKRQDAMAKWQAAYYTIGNMPNGTGAKLAYNITTGAIKGAADLYTQAASTTDDLGAMSKELTDEQKKEVVRQNINQEQEIENFYLTHGLDVQDKGGKVFDYANKIGSFIPTIVAFATGEGGLARVAETIVPEGVAKAAATSTMAGLLNYGNAYDSAIEAGKPDTDAKIFAAGSTLLNAMVFQINSPAEKLLGNKAISKLIFGKAEQDGVINLLKNPATYNEGLSKLYKTTLSTLAGTGLGAIQASAFNASDIANQLQLHGKLDLAWAQAAMDGIVVNGLVTGLLQGHGEMNRFDAMHGEQSLWQAAVEPDTYNALIGQKKTTGELTPQEAAIAKTNLNRASEIRKKIPVFGANGRPLKDAIRQQIFGNEYRRAQLAERINNTIDAEKPFLKQQIKNIDEQTQGLLGYKNQPGKKEINDNSAGISDTQPDIQPQDKSTLKKIKQIAKERKNNTGNDVTSQGNEKLPLADDNAENDLANNKLTETDNPEQEPDVKAVESTAENSNEAEELEIANKQAEQLKNNALDIKVKPVSEIHTDESRFQGREGLSEQKVNEIASNWNDADQDPIHIWTDPKNGKAYVLSGHHRLEAAKRAGVKNVKVIDRTNDFTENQAIKFATEDANANRTMETPLERAITLRKKRENGDSKEDIDNFIKREGKNGNYVNNLSFLDPKGKTIEALKSLDKNTDVDTQQRINKVADWIGEARKRNPALTNAHEQEMFDFLMDENNSKRIRTKADFLSKVHAVAGGFDFDAGGPLNIARFKYQGEGEKQYEEIANDLKNKINTAQDKIADIKARFTDPKRGDYISTDAKDYDEVKKNADSAIAKLNEEIKTTQQKLQEHYQNKARFNDNKQSALFHHKVSDKYSPVKQKVFNRIIKTIKRVLPNLNGITIIDGKAFKETAKSAKEGRFNVVGEKAALNEGDKAKLLMAKEMESKGRNEKEIWAATGWEKSREGNWQKDSDYIKVPDSTVKVFDDAMNGKDFVGKLKDVVDLGNLAELYPELKDLQVEFFNDQYSNDYGKLEPVLNENRQPIQRIVINTRSDVIAGYRESGYFKGERPILHANNRGVSESTEDGRQGRRTSRELESGWQGNTMLRLGRTHITQILSHEIQHFIADKEGWDKGANLKNEIQSVIDKRTKDFQKRYTQALSKGDTPLANRLKRDYSRIVRITPKQVQEGRYTDPHLQGIYREAYNNYLDNPGEIQARNAAIRAKLTPEERENIPISGSVDTKFFTNKNGEIYGFVHNGTMYLNGDKLNENTPVHEASHLFTQWTKDNALELHRAGLDKMNGTKYLADVKKDPFYKKQAEQLRSKGASDAEIEDFYRDEALARAVGDSGEKLAPAIKSAFRQWLNNFWNTIKEAFGKGSPKLENLSAEQVSKMTLGEFSDAVAGRLLSGEKLREEESKVSNKDARFMADNAAILKEDDFIKNKNGGIIGIKPEVKTAIEAERNKIISDAKENGTYLKAPNGEKSKLGESQWVTVRTKRFKDWFGDWELMHKETPLVKSELPSIRSIKTEREQLKNKIGETSVPNKDTGKNIFISKASIDKTLSEKAVNKTGNIRVQLAAAQRLPELIENAVLGESHFDKNEDKNIKQIHRYYSALDINGKLQRVLITVKEFNKPQKNHVGKEITGDHYYTSEVSAVEVLDRKSAEAGRVDDGSRVDPHIPQSSTVSIAKLLKGATKNNGEKFNTEYSKIVDENGEPLQMYHGTDFLFTSFNKERTLAESNDTRNFFFLSPKPSVAEHFANFRAMDDEKTGVIGVQLIPSFVNAKKPFDPDNKNDISFLEKSNSELYNLFNKNEKDNWKIIETPEFQKWLKDNKYDGFWVKEQVAGRYEKSLGVFEPEQIKSATGNTGTFSPETNDIRFYTEEESPINDLIDEQIKAAGKDAKPEDIQQKINDLLDKEIAPINKDYAEELKEITGKLITDKIRDSELPKELQSAIAKVPSGANTPEKQAAHYTEIMGSKPSAAQGAIQVDPIFGAKPQSAENIIFHLSTKLKRKIRNLKTGRAGGSYHTADAGIKIKYSGDLETTAHETGHLLDDKFGITKKEGGPGFEKQLNNFMNAEGSRASKPPKNVKPEAKLKYQRGEGFAEWLRAYIKNPKDAIRLGPEIFTAYQEKIPPDVKKIIDNFSKNFREFAGLSALDRTKAHIQMEPEKQASLMREIFKKKEQGDAFNITWVDKLAANWVDPLQVFHQAAEYLKGIKGIEELLPADDPYMLARLFTSTDKKFGEFLEKGIRDKKGNYMLDKTGNKINFNSLIQHFDNTDIKSIEDDMMNTLAYMASERMVELANRFDRKSLITGVGGGIITDADDAIETLKELNNGDPGRLERIKKSAEAYRAFADATMKYLVGTGRLSKEQYDLIKQHNLYYVAFNRIQNIAEDEPIEVVTHTGNNGKLGITAEPIKVLKGSTKKISNPYISLIKNLHTAIKEADRNNVMRAFRDLLINERDLHEGEPIPISNIAVLGKRGDKNSIPIFVNGKAEYWVFEPDLYKSLKGMVEAGYQFPPIVTFLPRMLRGSVVNFPVFQLRNITRDTFDRILKSTTKSGFKEFIGNKKDWEDIAVFGGLNAGYYMHNQASYYGYMKIATDELAKNKNVIVASGDMLKKGWNGYKSILEKGETLNRVAEYRSAYKKAKNIGYDDYNASLYAAFHARDLMDFALMGYQMKWINQLVPFSNAAVQGVRSGIKSAIKNPGGFAVRMLLYSVLPQTALWLWNHRNDDAGKQYEELPDYQRDLYWNIPVSPNKWLAIPKPYELGMPASAIDRGMSKYFGWNDKAYNGYAGQTVEALSPIGDWSSLAGPFAAPIEASANYNFFREKHIIPTYEEPLAITLRNTKYASSLGKAIQDVAGLDARKVDFLIRDMFSYYGNTALKLSDIGRKDKNDKFGLNDLGFIKDSPAYNSKTVQEMIDYAAAHRKTGTKEFKQFHKIAQLYFDAQTNEQKEQISKDMIDFADSLLERWEANN